MSLRFWKMGTCKLLDYWIMTRDYSILSLLILRSTPSLVRLLLCCIFVIVEESPLFWDWFIRRNVHLWLRAYTPLYHIQSYLEGWLYAWPSTYYNIRTNYDAWLCHHWKLCNFHGSSVVFQTQGTFLDLQVETYETFVCFCTFHYSRAKHKHVMISCDEKLQLLS